MKSATKQIFVAVLFAALLSIILFIVGCSEPPCDEIELMTECIDTDGCIYCSGCLDADVYGCCMGQKSYKKTEFNACCGSTPFSAGTGKCCGFPGTVVSKSTCCTNNQIGVCPDGQECDASTGACVEKCTAANCGSGSCAWCGGGDECYNVNNAESTCCGVNVIDSVALPGVKCCGGIQMYSESSQCCDPATGLVTSTTCSGGLVCDTTKSPATCKLACTGGKPFCNGICCVAGKYCESNTCSKSCCVGGLGDGGGGEYDCTLHMDSTTCGNAPAGYGMKCWWDTGKC